MAMAKTTPGAMTGRTNSEGWLWFVLGMWLLWCSSDKTTTAVAAATNTTTTPGVVDEDDSLWFVALVEKKSSSTVVCGGAYLGGRQVLTTRACLLNYPNPARALRVHHSSSTSGSSFRKIKSWQLDRHLAILTLKRAPKRSTTTAAVPHLGLDYHYEVAATTPLLLLLDNDNVDVDVDVDVTMVGLAPTTATTTMPLAKHATASKVTLCANTKNHTDLVMEEEEEPSWCLTTNATTTTCWGGSTFVVVPGTGSWEGRDVLLAVLNDNDDNDCLSLPKNIHNTTATTATMPTTSRPVVALETAMDFVLQHACSEQQQEENDLDWCLPQRRRMAWLSVIRLRGLALPLCSGFWVGGSWVVTAWQCVLRIAPSELQVQVGYHCRDADNCGRGSQLRPVQHIHAWAPQQVNVTVDLALLSLQQPLTSQPSFLPAIPYLGPILHPHQWKLQKKSDLTFVAIVPSETDEQEPSAAAVPHFELERQVVGLQFQKRKRCVATLPRLPAGTRVRDLFCTQSRNRPCLGHGGGPAFVPGQGPWQGRDLIRGVARHDPSGCFGSRQNPVSLLDLSQAATFLQSVACGPQQQQEEEEQLEWCPASLES